MPFVPELRRQRQADNYELEARDFLDLKGYIVKPYFKKRREKGRKEKRTLKLVRIKALMQLPAKSFKVRAR